MACGALLHNNFIHSKDQQHSCQSQTPTCISELGKGAEGAGQRSVLQKRAWMYKHIYPHAYMHIYACMCVNNLHHPSKRSCFVYSQTVSMHHVI